MNNTKKKKHLTILCDDGNSYTPIKVNYNTVPKILLLSVKVVE